MVQNGRYVVKLFDSYQKLCDPQLPYVSVVYVNEINTDVVQVEEIDNKRGAGAMNTIGREIFEELLADGVISKDEY